MASAPAGRESITEDDMTTQVKEATSSAVEKAGDALQGAKERAGEGAGGAMDTARQRAREQVDQRSTQVGERAAGTAGDIRSVSEELRKQGKDGPARVADRAAEQVERAGSYLRDADADTLLGDVERIGRERPWAIVAAGLAIGIVAGRALKASSGRRYSQSQGALPSGVGSDADTRPSGLGGR
jgi:hypothetical protein